MQRRSLLFPQKIFDRLESSCLSSQPFTRRHSKLSRRRTQRRSPALCPRKPPIILALVFLPNHSCGDTRSFRALKLKVDLRSRTPSSRLQTPQTHNPITPIASGTNPPKVRLTKNPPSSPPRNTTGSPKPRAARLWGILGMLASCLSYAVLISSVLFVILVGGSSCRRILYEEPFPEI